MVSNSQLKLIESIEKNEWTTVNVFFYTSGVKKGFVFNYAKK